MDNNTNTTIKDAVLDRISAENVTPKSKWYFLARHAALWTPGAAVTVLGGFAMASILFSMLHAGWEYRAITRPSLATFLLTVIPLIWIVSLVVFGMVIVKTLRFTAKGYRYKTSAILLGSFCVSFLIGVSLVALDMTVKRNSFIRFSAERTQKTLWVVPEEGRLAGILSINGDMVTLLDTNGEQWAIDASGIIEDSLLAQDTSVRIVGEITGDHTFFACLMMPWEFTPNYAPRDTTLSPQPRRPFQDRIEQLSSRCKEIVQAARPQGPRAGERKFVPQP